MRRFETQTDWLLKKARQGQVWCALFGLALALSLASGVESVRVGSGIDAPQLNDRAIDPSVAESLSTAAIESPGGLFYLTLGASFLFLFLVLSLLNGWVQRDLGGEAVEGERSAILLLSQISLALYALHSIVGAAVPESIRTLVHLLAGLLIVSMGAKAIVRSRLDRRGSWTVVWTLLSDGPIMQASLFLPVAVIGVAGLAGGRLNPLSGAPMALSFCFYLVVYLFMFAIFVVVAGRRYEVGRPGMALALYDLNTSVIVAGAPLVLIPFGLLLANEAQFALPRISPRILGSIVVALLAAASLILISLRRSGRLKVGGVAMLTGFYFPALVAMLASFRTHLWTLELGTLDYLRAGDFVVPTHQWWAFGKIPILDLLPDQGLADVGVQSLFAIFHGVDNLDMLIWLPWIPLAVGYLVVYAFLALVTSPLLALLVTVLLPVQSVVVGQYAMALLPVAVLVFVIRRPSFRSLLGLWLVTALLLVWRPRLGWPVALAVLAIVVLVVLFENRSIMGQALSSLLVVLGLLPAGLLVAEVFGGGDSYLALQGLFDLMWGSDVRGFGVIETDSAMPGVAMLLPGLLPVFAVVGVLSYLVRRWVRRDPVGSRGYAVLCLIVFSMVLPARIVIEDGHQLLDPSLILLALALAPFLLRGGMFRARQVGRSTWLVTILVLCTLLGPVAIPQLVGGGVDHGQLRTWRSGESRVLYNSRPHRNVVKFLRSKLEGDETFLDFTGSTILYALASQQYPLRALTDFRATSESEQRQQALVLERWRADQGVPLVVFRARSESGKLSSEPPTEALSYRIAELIYSDYVPFAMVDGWEIWRERGVPRGRPGPRAKTISASTIRQNFKLGFLPYRWAKEDSWQSVSRTDVLAPVLERPAMVRAGKAQTLFWFADEGLPVATYLHIRALPMTGLRTSDSSSVEPTITLSYGTEPQNSFAFQLVSGSAESGESGETVSLPLHFEPRKHGLRRVPGHPDRLWFKATGRDPWLQRFVDLSGAPTLELGRQQWITLRYRSTTKGTVQIFFAEREDRFAERHSVKIPIAASEENQPSLEVEVPILGIPVGGRLGSLRLDPSGDGEFEIVGVDLGHDVSRADDYLIRLTTQLQWSRGETRQLTLRTNAPVLIESAVLRAGD